MIRWGLHWRETFKKSLVNQPWCVTKRLHRSRSLVESVPSFDIDLRLTEVSFVVPSYKTFRGLRGIANRITRDLLITRGILNSSLVHPREVFRAAIAEAAASVIVVHNHPSGQAAPSADDRAVTAQLVEAGRILDVPVYDHVIVGGDGYFSFAEAGLL